jgi:multiple sugar transport system substrate-binding protein
MEPEGGSLRPARAALIILAAAALLALVLYRSGMAGALVRTGERAPRKVLRVWDWWSPALSEKYADYFSEVEREFERRYPEADVRFQFVPFTQYEQKMATAMVGNTPPDVFQSSVSFAEGFYDRGMLLRLNSFLERERAERERLRREGRSWDPGQVVDREAFLEAAWRHNHKPDGSVFGIPQSLDANCLIWNLDHLREAAASDPEIRGMFERRPDGSLDEDRLRFDAVKDWEQFRRIARRLTKYDASGRPALDGKGLEVRTGFVIHAHGSGAAPVSPWLAACGTNFQDPAGTRATFADEAGVEVMQLLLDLYWKDRVTPAFRHQLTDEETFNTGRVACFVGGTWSGKYIVRNTEGRRRFDLTPFPPGPRGSGHTTLSWGNMLVVSRRTPDPDLAWKYVKFITSLEGALRLLRCIEQNSPRADFYESPAWREETEKQPYLHNVPAIAASGRKLRHTQINAVDHASKPVFETILLRYPDIQAGRGPYPSVRAGLERGAAAVNRVYDRYNEQVAYWQARPSAARQAEPAEAAGG